MKLLKIFIILFSIIDFGFSQFKSDFLSGYPIEYRITGNYISNIRFYKNNLWVVNSKGLVKSTDNGTTWVNYIANSAFTRPDIYSFDLCGDSIWCSLGYQIKVQSDNVPVGAGFAISKDGGNSWSHIDQPVDPITDTIIIYGNNRISALPINVPQANVSYSTSISKNSVWIHSWYGGLRKSTDFGATFKRIVLPPDVLNSIKPDDSLNMQLNPNTNRNHLGFSVLAVNDNEIWAGTAGGVNRSTDGGISWKKFSVSNQDSAILGNWVLTIKQQKFNSINRIWLINWKTDKQNEEYGASYTENNGNSWKHILIGKKLYTFAFKDSIIYIGGATGIFRSADNGKSFQLFNNMIDPETRFKVMSPAVYSIDVKNDTIWFGTGDGLVYTIDNENIKFGTKWKIFRAYQSIEKLKSYAYPNPFSPDDEIVRIHYTMPKDNCNISIEIFDFGMNLIRRVISNVVRSGNPEQEEIWNGKDEGGRRAPNGIYFYRVKMDNDYSWGKILVLQ